MGADAEDQIPSLPLLDGHAGLDLFQVSCGRLPELRFRFKFLRLLEFGSGLIQDTLLVIGQAAVVMGRGGQVRTQRHGAQEPWRHLLVLGQLEMREALVVVDQGLVGGGFFSQRETVERFAIPFLVVEHDSQAQIGTTGARLHLQQLAENCLRLTVLLGAGERLSQVEGRLGIARLRLKCFAEELFGRVVPPRFELGQPF